MESVCQTNSKAGWLDVVLVFSTFIGAAFYAMIIWSMLKPSDRQQTIESWSWFYALFGFSPVPFILFSATLMIIKVAND